MDQKYLGKTVPLPKETADNLESYRAELQAQLGFKVSLSDAIANLLKRNRESANNGKQ